MFKDDYPGEQSWRLLDWCVSRGADEFSVAMLSLEDSHAPFLDRVDRLLKPFALAPAPREYTVGAPRVREAPLWSVTPGSLQMLRQVFHDGLFTYPTSSWERLRRRPNVLSSR